MSIAFRPNHSRPATSGDPLGDCLDPRRPVLVFRRDYDDDTVVATHCHLRGQLLYASRGLMSVETAAGKWFVPSQQAVWVPPFVEHQVRIRRPLAMRSLYIDPSATQHMPADCFVVAVTPLLRELILEAAGFSNDDDVDGAKQRLLSVLLDQLRCLKAEPLYLPQPSDPRLVKIVSALIEDPGCTTTLHHLAAAAGMSERTAARRFLAQTGMTLNAWRIQLRLVTALERLAAGQSVTEVALALGYNSPSAFVARFKKTFGLSPVRYVNVNRH